ncbi:DciA family protein [Leifsonia sp. F6_8S_P_1B]|uniref:DciA family protein n=1 Tax=Leifsonia williamsii TaxID=3035919 RepID=A0ABT8K8Y1_9MICO|nr:DciA family protein [Leifsonia williamsii]MDN4613492.1 DciA family protein [Leifsonia williamsii]
MPERPDKGGMSEASAVYLRMKELFAGTTGRGRRARRQAEEKPGESKPFGAGRDPRGIGDVMDALTVQLGWTPQLAQSDLLEQWRELAGEETARHAVPDAITDGVLVVRCESTAWATQLRMMRSELLVRIGERFPEAGIESIRFQGPDAPSWKRGPRSIPGRGPRDTYG